MEIEKLLSVEDLRARLDYNSSSGALIWKARPVAVPQDQWFNARYAGRRAGCKDNGGRRLCGFRVNGVAVRVPERRVIEALELGMWPKKKLNRS